MYRLVVVAGKAARYSYKVNVDVCLILRRLIFDQLNHNIGQPLAASLVFPDRTMFVVVRIENRKRCRELKRR